MTDYYAEYNERQMELHSMELHSNKKILNLKLVIWMVKKLLEVFMKKNCKKLIKKNLESRKST